MIEKLNIKNYLGYMGSIPNFMQDFINKQNEIIENVNSLFHFLGNKELKKIYFEIIRKLICWKILKNFFEKI